MAKRKKAELEIEIKPGETWTSAQKTHWRKSKKWLDFRLEVIKERKVCECCGSGNGGLTLHHHYLTDKAEDYINLDKSRFHVLCNVCHRFIHSRSRTIERKKNPPIPLQQLKEIINKFIET